MKVNLVVILHRVDTVSRRGVPDSSVGKDMIGRINDELLRVDVGEEPVKGLAVHLLAEVQPVGNVLNFFRCH
jgi:hypothetical protein